MRCKSCGGVNLRKFPAEIGIHFPGFKNIDVPAIWVFPELAACLECGMTEFAVPEGELRLLARERAPHVDVGPGILPKMRLVRFDRHRGMRRPLPPRSPSTRTCVAGRLESAPHRPTHSASHRRAFSVKLINELRWQSDCYMFHARHKWMVTFFLQRRPSLHIACWVQEDGSFPGTPGGRFPGGHNVAEKYRATQLGKTARGWWT